MGRPELWDLGEDCSVRASPRHHWWGSLHYPNCPGPSGTESLGPCEEQMNRLGEELGFRSRSLIWMRSLGRECLHSCPFWAPGSLLLRLHFGPTANLWYMLCVLLSLLCSEILDIVASHCWRIESEFYKLPSEYPFHPCPETPISVSWWHTTHFLSSVFAHAIHFFLLKAFLSFSSSLSSQALTWKLHTQASWPRSNFTSSVNPSWVRPIYLLAGRI